MTWVLAVDHANARQQRYEGKHSARNVENRRNFINKKYKSCEQKGNHRNKSFFHRYVIEFETTQVSILIDQDFIAIVKPLRYNGETNITFRADECTVVFDLIEFGNCHYSI